MRAENQECLMEIRRFPLKIPLRCRVSRGECKCLEMLTFKSCVIPTSHCEFTLVTSESEFNDHRRSRLTCLDPLSEGGRVDGAGTDAVHPDATLHKVHRQRPT